MKKIKILILTVLGVMALACACLAAGCKFDLSLDEIKDKYGLTAQVTYFLNLHQGKDGKYNGGKFNDSLLIKNIYYKEGEIPLNIGEVRVSSGSTNLQVDDGYKFSGWHSVATDPDTGALLYEDGSAYSETDEFDGTKAMQEGEDYKFNKPLAKGEHLYLCGDFYEDVKLRFKFFCAEDDFDVEIKSKDAGGKEVVTGKYKPGKDIIDEVSYIVPRDGELDDVTNIVDIPGYTVIGLYENPSDAQPYSGWPIKYPEAQEDGERPDAVLYAKLLKGTWRLVRTPSDVQTMFSRAMQTNYYVLNDIDCGGLQVSTRNSFAGQISGGKDGHVISNFAAKNPVALGNGGKGSLFGDITKDAAFKNVTFKDFSVEFEVRKGQDPDINFFAKSIDDKATFEKFTISGVLNVKIVNNDAETAKTLSIHANTWIFGSNKVYDGITVEKAVCIVNGEERFKVDKTINTETYNTEDQL